MVFQQIITYILTIHQTYRDLLRLLDLINVFPLIRYLIAVVLSVLCEDAISDRRFETSLHYNMHVLRLDLDEN